MDEQNQPVSGYLQTIAQNNPPQRSGSVPDDIPSPREQVIKNSADLETDDILFKYQQRRNQRKSNGDQHAPTRRSDLNASYSGVTERGPTCLRQSIPLMLAWLGLFTHITIALLPYTALDGKLDMDDFHEQYTLNIGPARWNLAQFGIDLLWQAVLLTYLSLIIAEHTLMILPSGFYYGLAGAHTFIAVWNVLTERLSFGGRALTWFGAIVCLTWTNFCILKHVYSTYDVTKYVPPSRFRLDSVAVSGHDDDYAPPLPLQHGQGGGSNAKHINAILRIQNGGSLNSSPVSMSMAPSAAQKLVYDAAMGGTPDENVIQTKIRDVTRIKYCGLVGLVFNGVAFFLSAMVVNFWVQIGQWLVYECKVSNDTASLVSLMLTFISLVVYYLMDFLWYQKYLVANFATHVVFSVTFAAMVSKHFFGNKQGRSTTDILQMVGFCIVMLMLSLKTIKSIYVHRTCRREAAAIVTQNNGQYKRVA